jgi:phenylalanyl-tRNA synthetase alpha chain
MSAETAARGLHPLEVRLLRHFRKGDTLTSSRAIEELSFNLGQFNQAVSWLQAKGLLQETGRVRRTEYGLSDLGQVYRREGTPEERIYRLVRDQGPLSLPQIAERLGLESREAGSAFGTLSKEGLLAMDEEKRVRIRDESRGGFLQTVRRLLDRFDSEEAVIEEGSLPSDEAALAASLSRKRGAGRGLFKVSEREEVRYALSEAGAEARNLLLQQGVTGEEIGSLTPEVLKTGLWKERGFRPYNIHTPQQRFLIGRKNPYVEFLERLKDKLISLGFEEFDGPLLETEFWNGDALFMPQFHSARDIHDVYYVKDPSHAREIEQPYLDRVSATHENGWQTGSRGWRYAFDREFTRRMILRSHGTVLSAKTLPKADVPGKYFGVVRCFRYDRVDATHLADFYQTEGIVLGEQANLRTLLGLLKMFAEEVAGAKEVKYVPGYFPFTEPSVEVHIRHPELGWFELGGSGIFRPEVTRPLGVDVPVLAWGLGIDRMALTSLGLNDLRDLFSPDIEQVRMRRRLPAERL